MAMQLKTGADLNNMPLSRFVIENLIADPTNNIKAGSKYFNTGTGTLANRERIYAGGKWRSTAYMDDIDALQKQLDELDFAGSEEFQTLSGRVLTIEGLFNNGKAKDAEKLGGQLPSYYATADGLSALQQKVNAFLDGEVDSDGVLENLKEIQAFLDSYDGATSLAEIIDSINTQIADRYTKAESDGRYLPLDGTKAMSGVLEAPKGIKIGNVVISIDNDGNLKIDGNAYATGELGSGQVAGEGGGGSTGGGYTAFDDSITWADYDDSMADWLLTAYHGKLFNDRIATLENKATKVEVSNLLTSGTKIATIKVDANSYDILAPSTDWSAITNKPTTIEGYGITDTIKYNTAGIDISGDTIPLNHIGYGYTIAGWPRNAVAMSIGVTQNYWAQLQFGNAQMSFRTNVGGTISDWCNVLTNNNYELELNKTYLRLVGGTINGSLIISDNFPIIAFTQNGVRGEGIGMNGGKLVCYNATSTSSYAILHSNNIGEYAFAVNKNANYTKTPLASILLGYVAEETDGVTGDFCLLNLPTWTANSESKYYASQIKFSINLNKYSGLEVRTVTESTNGDWRTLIDTENHAYFLGSSYLKTDGSNASGTFGIDITGNATTATKLKNTVYLWGNAFDGSKSINNQLVLAYDTSIRVKSSIEDDATGLHVFSTFSSNNMYFGYGARTAGWGTHIYGNHITFVPKTGTAALEITDSGNTIIKTALILENEKSLYFYNSAKTNSYNALTFSKNNALYIGYDNTTFNGYATHIYGGNIYFCTAAANGTPTIAMSINSAGQVSLNGTIIANGDGVVFKNSSIVYWKGTDNINKNILTYNSNKLLAIGYSMAEEGNTTALYGNTIKLLAGESRTLAMTITSGGRFILGSSQVEEPNATVTISGSAHVHGATSMVALGVYPSVGITTGVAKQYGTTIWAKGDGTGNIQAMRYDGSATAYALNLNPIGGNVNIASANATTNVLGSLVVEKDLTTRGSIVAEGGTVTIGKTNGTGNASLLFYRNTANYIWANNEGGYFIIGVKDKGAQGGQNASLIITDTSVFGGHRTNEVSLGTSSYRWSDVYSVKGNFHNLTIGYLNGYDHTIDFVNGTTTDGNYDYRIGRFTDKDGYAGFGMAIGKLDGTWSKFFNVAIDGQFNVTSVNVFAPLKVTSRVLIGNVVDDGSSTLQLYGDISADSTNIYFKAPGGWAKGLYALGSSGNRLGGIGFYAYGDVLNNIWIGSYDAPWVTFNSTEANFNILTKFNSSVKIGEATLSYENGALKVDKNFFAEGEVASGKVAEEGTGGNTPSGSGLEIKTFDIASTTENQMVELAHNLGTRDVVVQIFENSRSSNYQQVFADVYYVDTAKVAINFGAAQTVPHRVIIMG